MMEFGRRGLAGLLAVLSSSVVLADHVLVEGGQEAAYVLRGLQSAVVPSSYANNGYRQTVQPVAGGFLVKVQVDVKPLESRARYPTTGADYPPEAWEALLPSPEAPTRDPEIIRLVGRLVHNAATEYEAVSRIVDFVGSSIHYEVDPSLSTDALGTLHAGKAYCVGMTNLTAAMLRTAGIPAREIHGILVQRKEALAGKEIEFSSAELHRYLEVYLTDVGWVFSDPLRSANYVDAYHLVVCRHRRRGGYHPSCFRGARLKMVQDRNATFEVDRARATGRYTLLRPNRPGRFSGAIVGVVTSNRGKPMRHGTVMVTGGGYTRRVQIGRGGKFSFTGVAPGVYRVHAFCPGYSKATETVRLAKRELRRLRLEVIGSDQGETR